MTARPSTAHTARVITGSIRKTPTPEVAKVFRQGATTRLSHWAITLAFLVLAITGTMQRFHLKVSALNAPRLHLAFAVAMLVIGIGYYVQALANGTIRRLILRKRDVPALWPMMEYYLGRRSTPPVCDGYNPLQRAAYTGLLFVLAPVLALSGLALWPHAWFAHGLAMLFGGRSSYLWHFIFAVALVFFAAGHTVMVAATGFTNNMRSMITGWYEPHGGARGKSADTADCSVRPLHSHQQIPG